MEVGWFDNKWVGWMWSTQGRTINGVGYNEITKYSDPLTPHQRQGNEQIDGQWLSQEVYLFVFSGPKWLEPVWMSH